MTDIDVLLEKIVVENEAASPRELTTLALADLDETDYFATLDKVLPVYVRQWLSTRRVWRENTPVVPVEQTFAPDDLLSDEGQATAKKVLKARGSARVSAIRNEWQRHFADSLWTGEGYIKFGDATANDLTCAATSLRTSAKAEYEGKVSKAEYYEAIASALPAGARVRDLDADPTRK